MKYMTLSDLGYDSFFEVGKTENGFADYLIARVISEHKESYRVAGEGGEFTGRITGKQMFEAKNRSDYPAVGDWVAISKADEENVVIHGVLPRKTVFSKKYSNKQDSQIIASNVDTVFVVESVNQDYSLNRLERYFVLADKGGIHPVVLLSKTDLISKEEINQKKAEIRNRFGGVEILLVSTLSTTGMEELIGFMEKGKTYCLIGSSGVGKSSIVNALLGNDHIKTGGIDVISGKGRHTTTGREMYFLSNGSIIIDNPGTREVGIGDAGESMENVFSKIDILARQCKYSDCTHVHESGCAVLKAVESKELDEEQYENYLKLKKESEYYEMDEINKREKDKQFGKFLKQSLKDLKRFKGR